MNYNEMSDFKINVAVAKAAGRYMEVPKGMHPVVVGDVQCYYDEQRTLWDCHFNYCGSPADAWLIIVENKIDIAFHKNCACAAAYCFVEEKMKSVEVGCVTVPTAACKNPLRAAMIVFLMMQEQSDEN